MRIGIGPLLIDKADLTKQTVNKIELGKMYYKFKYINFFVLWGFKNWKGGY